MAEPAPEPEGTEPAPGKVIENLEPGRPPLTPAPVKQVKVHHETLFDDAPDK